MTDTDTVETHSSGIHDADRTYTVHQLAAYLQVTPDYVYRETRAGRLPAVRLGKAIRFTPADIETYLRSKRKRSSLIHRREDQ